MFISFVTFFFLLAALPGFSQTTNDLTVYNQGESRENTIITFPYGAPSEAKSLVLVDPRDGKSYPVQILNSGEAVSIISIGSDERKTFKLETRKPQQSKGVLIEEGENIRILVNSKQVIGFQTGRSALPKGVEPVYRRGGYVHPVLSPSGLQITDDYPLDHKHHHGIWAAWTKTAFRGRNPDFWNVADNTGNVEFQGFDEIQAGPVLATLTSKNSYVDKTSLPHTEVLKENFNVRVYNITGFDKPFYVFDVETKQRCVTSDPLLLLKHIYGGIAFRGNGAWNGKQNASFLTSGGKDRETGNTDAANWVRVSGQVGGTLTGITILSHPGNFRAPQPLRIHPTEPYISFAPSQAGEFRIVPGNDYVARYRFIVYDGEPDTDFIKRMWNDYSNPLKVELSQNHD